MHRWTAAAVLYVKKMYVQLHWKTLSIWPMPWSRLFWITSRNRIPVFWIFRVSAASGATSPRCPESAPLSLSASSAAWALSQSSGTPDPAPAAAFEALGVMDRSCPSPPTDSLARQLPKSFIITSIATAYTQKLNCSVFLGVFHRKEENWLSPQRRCFTANMPVKSTEMGMKICAPYCSNNQNPP